MILLLSCLSRLVASFFFFLLRAGIKQKKFGVGQNFETGKTKLTNFIFNTDYCHDILISHSDYHHQKYIYVISA